MKTHRITQRSTASFSLVEVALALGVAAFCLIAILGLLPAGLNTNQNSTRQTTANGILSSIVADLRATPSTSTASTLFGICMTRSTTLCCDGNGACSISSGGCRGRGGSGGGDEEGGGSGTQCANAIFLATITFSGEGGGDDGEEGSGGSGTERFDVTVSWPYSAASSGDGGDGGSAQSARGGSVETFVAVDRNIASHKGDEDRRH